MGYVSSSCAICEGPADLEQWAIDSEDEYSDFSTQADRERVTWMLDRIGVTETEGPSAVWRVGQELPDSVVSWSSTHTSFMLQLE